MITKLEQKSESMRNSIEALEKSKCEEVLEEFDRAIAILETYSEPKSLSKSATIVDKAISEIRALGKSAFIMRKYDCFDYDLFQKVDIDRAIKEICIKHDISEEHVRQVAGFGRNKINLELWLKNV